MRLRTPVVLVLVALATLVLIALGVWQLERNAEKQDLERSINAAIAAQPLEAAEAVTAPRDAVEWHRVSVSGSWDIEQAQFVGNRTRFGLRGEEIVVPARVTEGAPALLVDLGWYPIGEREQTLAQLEDEPPTSIVGVARYLDPPASLVDGAWSRLSTERMGEALPYNVAPFVVIAGEKIDPNERVAPDVRPVPGFEGYQNTIPHVEYALTWFGLAVALVATATVRVARGNRPKRPASDPGNAQEGNGDDGHEAD